MSQKPKNSSKNPARDNCQTPAYALDPLLPYLPNYGAAWECACGEEYLVRALREKTKLFILPTDIEYGCNFLERDLLLPYTMIVTNPPFSLKYKFLERCYALGKPFALLMPGDVLFSGFAQSLFQEYGIEILLMNRRVDYKMPNKGWGGSAQFSSAWFTHGLNIGRQITFTELIKPKRSVQEVKETQRRSRESADYVARVFGGETAESEE